MLKLLGRICVSSRAATAIEYGLILALIAMASLVAFRSFGASAMGMWDNIKNNVVNNT